MSWLVVGESDDEESEGSVIPPTVVESTRSETAQRGQTPTRRSGNGIDTIHPVWGALVHWRDYDPIAIL